VHECGIVQRCSHLCKGRCLGLVPLAYCRSAPSRALGSAPSISILMNMAASEDEAGHRRRPRGRNSVCSHRRLPQATQRITIFRSQTIVGAPQGKSDHPSHNVQALDIHGRIFPRNACATSVTGSAVCPMLKAELLDHERRFVHFVNTAAFLLGAAVDGLRCIDLRVFVVSGSERHAAGGGSASGQRGGRPTPVPVQRTLSKDRISRG
jgi:hypothetical protein